MAAHRVHEDADGHLAVVAVLLTTGGSNGPMKTALANLAHEKEHEALVDSATLYAADLLPKSRSYYTFMGAAWLKSDDPRRQLVTLSNSVTA